MLTIRVKIFTSSSYIDVTYVRNYILLYLNLYPTWAGI
jgi:hypothetical protein